MCHVSNWYSLQADPKAYTSLGQNAKSEKPGQSILNLLDVGDDPAGRAVLRSRLLKFFGMLPLLSVHHARLLMQAVDAFFGARLYCSNLSVKDSKGNNKSCAIGAVRLVCHFLRKAKDFLSSQHCDVADLQLHVVRHVAAAYLSAPCTQAKGLADAVGAAILASANGGPCFDWAGKHADQLRHATRSVLRDWSPTTSAKPTILLLQEIHYAGQVPVETGREFAQEALDTAADLRHDLAVLGLTSTLKTGMKTSTKTLYVPNPKVGYWSKPETKKPKMEENHMENGEDADEEERFSWDFLEVFDMVWWRDANMACGCCCCDKTICHVCFFWSDLVFDFLQIYLLKSQSVANPFNLKSQDRWLVALEQ